MEIENLAHLQSMFVCSRCYFIDVPESLENFNELSPRVKSGINGLFKIVPILIIDKIVVMVNYVPQLYERTSSDE